MCQVFFCVFFCFFGGVWTEDDITETSIQVLQLISDRSTTEALSRLTSHFLEHFLKDFVTDVLFCLYNSILTSAFVFSSIGLFAVKKT